MSGPMQNMVVSLVLMQGSLRRRRIQVHLLTRLLFPAVARKIPFDDPQVLNYVRIAYVTAQAIILGTYFFTAQKVRPASSRALSMRGRLHHTALSDQVEERPDGAQIC
jgi:hypothetical protein